MASTPDDGKKNRHNNEPSLPVIFRFGLFASVGGRNGQAEKTVSSVNRSPLPIAYDTASCAAACNFIIIPGRQHESKPNIIRNPEISRKVLKIKKKIYGLIIPTMDELLL
ncbi:Hypothetical protein CINCED_3A019772 [Cinara cedri]|uniref:Uncharacterized protein n=1 Tax=Cinara cedri TaxID=506608 RepID=A0A5E4M1M9_9HEMI|nr:Hypothetical protein CINCED_3A019772 [Cinara cedri]